MPILPRQCGILIWLISIIYGEKMNYWIAVVDDETVSLTNARNLLNKENIKVSCFRSGADLLKFVEKNTPDLILLDIMMPDMDGFETYSALRKFEDDNNRAHIPVIYLTGESDSETERRGLKAGASDFIHKPINIDILLSRIQKTITNSKTIESLTEEATTDKLTGFLNKAGGTAKITSLCGGAAGSLVLIDLDNFKLVNDLFGHDMGDRVLKAFADIIRRNTRETDVVSRIGGDEFLAFFPDMIEESSVASLTKRLNSQIHDAASELMGKDNGIPLGISVGAVMIPEHGRNFESLFSMADSALYTTKQNGKHGYSIFEGFSAKDSGNADPAIEIERICKIVGERNEKDEAFLLGREAFSNVYRYIIRSCKSAKADIAKVLFMIRYDNETSDQDRMKFSSEIGKILQKKLLPSDLILQNKSDQFFAVLVGRDAGGAAAVAEEIASYVGSSSEFKNVKLEYSITEEHYS